MIEFERERENCRTKENNREERKKAQLLIRPTRQPMSSFFSVKTILFFYHAGARMAYLNLTLFVIFPVLSHVLASVYENVLYYLQKYGRNISNICTVGTTSNFRIHVIQNRARVYNLLPLFVKSIQVNGYYII